MEKYENFTPNNSTSKSRIRVEVTHDASPGKRFEDALRQVLSVPKAEVDRRVAEEKKVRSSKRRD